MSRTLIHTLLDFNSNPILVSQAIAETYWLDSFLKMQLVMLQLQECQDLQNLDRLNFSKRHLFSTHLSTLSNFENSMWQLLLLSTS